MKLNPPLPSKEGEILTVARKSILGAVGVIALTTLLSRLLGFVRDWFIYTHFGETYLTDAFNAAFSVPDFIYMLLVGGALSSAFIPVFSSYLALDREEYAWKMASIVFNFTMLVLVVTLILAYAYAHPLLFWLAPKLPPEYLGLAVYLTRIMMIQCFFMALNGLALGILNSHNHFSTPAWGGIIYNLGIIAVGIALVNKLGITAFAYGVVIGSALNFFIQIPALIRIGTRYWPTLDIHNQGFRQAAILMVPVLIGLSVTQFNLFVSQNLASGLAAGSITALKIAQRLMQMPLGIFAMSIAMAIFPIMTSQAAKEEYSDLKQTLSTGLRAVIFITLPATAGLIAIGQPTISLMFEWKSFSAANTLATAQALVYYSLGLTAYSALQILNRVYYALKNTIVPVTVGVTTIILNIYLSYRLVQPLSHLGLALAYSLAGIFNAIFLIIILRWRLGPIDGRRIFSCLGLSTFISLLMLGLVKGWIHILEAWLSLSPRIEELLAVVSGIVLGAGFYAAMSLWLGMDEALMVKSILARRFPDFWNRLTR